MSGQQASLADIPHGYVSIPTDNGQHTLVPHFMVLATYQEMEAYQKKAEFNVHMAHGGVRFPPFFFCHGHYSMPLMQGLCPMPFWCPMPCLCLCPMPCLCPIPCLWPMLCLWAHILPMLSIYLSSDSSSLCSPETWLMNLTIWLPETSLCFLLIQ